MKDGFDSYSEHYHRIREAIEEIENRLMSNADMVDEAVENIQEQDPVYAWDKVAPETEHERADAFEDGIEEDHEFSIMNPDDDENLRFASNTAGSNASTLAVQFIPDLLTE